MGTHDLDTVKGPFTYEALSPEEIVFAPLNQKKVMNGKELMEFYEVRCRVSSFYEAGTVILRQWMQNDRNLGKYLNIIKDSPVYPVILDADRTVCSLPPIINSNHSKITLDTRNVFIEVTATDRTKVEIVTNILVAMFSQYCDEAFTYSSSPSPH